jgi:hypothetical protein
MSQSVNAGFKLRASVEYFSPFSKITRKRWEERKLWRGTPAAPSRSHISDQAEAAFLIPICDPVWFISTLNWIPAGLPWMQARFPEPLKVGVGQNEQPFAGMRPANFRR